MPRLLYFFLSLTAFAQPPLAIVSAATYQRDAALSPGMIATGFAAGIAGTGLTVAVRDSGGVDRPAEVVAIAPGQISFVIPAATALGQATVTVIRQGAAMASCTIRIARVAPGIFTANASGSGAPAGFVLQIFADGARARTNLFESFPGQSSYEPRPFDPDKTDAETYLILFGTGIRAAALANVSARIGGTPVPVQAAQAQPEFPGLDQVNVGPLPRTIAGRRGLAELQLLVEGVPANSVTVAPTAPAAAAWGRRAELKLTPKWPSPDSTATSTSSAATPPAASPSPASRSTTRSPIRGRSPHRSPPLSTTPSPPRGTTSST